jgi:hypothetical protein
MMIYKGYNDTDPLICKNVISFQTIYTEDVMNDFLKKIKYLIITEKINNFLKYHTEDVINKLRMETINQLWDRWYKLPRYLQLKFE